VFSFYQNLSYSIITHFPSIYKIYVKFVKYSLTHEILLNMQKKLIHINSKLNKSSIFLLSYDCVDPVMYVKAFKSSFLNYNLNKN